MSLRDHRRGTLYRTRRRQADLVRKAGPHVKDEKYIPEVCPECLGLRLIPDDEASICPTCQGEGEI